MRKALVIAIAAVCSAPAVAATSAHCDATPFTLGKPTAIPKAQDAQPKSKPLAVEPAAKKPQAKPQAKQRLLANCKAKKTKSD
jgi:hypothetical protein